jgi:hypothetical protein
MMCVEIAPDDRKETMEFTYDKIADLPDHLMVSEDNPAILPYGSRWLESHRRERMTNVATELAR